MKKSIRLFTKITQVVILIPLCFTLNCQQKAEEEIAATSPQGLSVKVAGLAPNGWEIYDNVLHFKAENLYEQINGRAEFYLAYDMIGMTFASFERSAKNEHFIDLSIYDMGTPANAFGVFSGERSKGISLTDLGRDAYRSGANYYIWKGQYYAQIIASDSTDELRRIGMDLAQKVSDFLLDSGEPVWGLNALPQVDRIPESERYFLVDAMGLDFMRNTYIAQYTKDDAVVTVFLSQRDYEEYAHAAVTQYVEHANKYGEVVKRLTVDGVELILCDMGGSYDVIFQKGGIVGGVSAVEDQSMAIQAATDLLRQLRNE